MRDDYLIEFPDGRQSRVAGLSHGEIIDCLDAIAVGDMERQGDGDASLDCLRERLLIEQVVRSLPE